MSRFYASAARYVFPTRAEAVRALAEYDEASTTPADVPVSYSVESHNPQCGLTGFCVFVKRPGWQSGWLAQ